MEGLLLIDKPSGISSFGVVYKVRKIATERTRFDHIKHSYCPNKGQNHGVCKCRVKVGHIGTLDPAATGLLVLAMGSYTKKVPELIKQDKTYTVSMTLGKVSSTGDAEGEIKEINSSVPMQVDINRVLQTYSGELLQKPPAYSAIKVNGQRAYHLARKGTLVDLPARPITVYSNTLVAYTYPIVTFISHVGSGTYIRSLVGDIGATLGTGAYMSDLRRTAIGSFSINDAVTLDSLNTENIASKLYYLKSDNESVTIKPNAINTNL